LAKKKKEEYFNKYCSCLYSHGALRLDDYQNEFLKRYKEKYSKLLPYKIADALFNDISYLLLIYR